MGDLRARKRTSKKKGVEGNGGETGDSKVTAEATKYPIEEFGPSILQSSAFLWIGGVLAVVALYCVRPTLFNDIIGFWIGYSEHYGVQTLAESPETRPWLPADAAKRDAVVDAFRHAWHAYERDAMGSDEYHPLSQNGSNLTEAGGIGYMVVDVLDTMQLMGLDEEYNRARSWIEKLSFDRDGEYSTFETTIRVLGGLLSAYHLSGQDELYLEKAIDLADRLLHAFESESGLPYPYVNLRTGTGHHSKDYIGLVSPAEVGTLQLEFKYLSHLIDDPKYWRSVEKVMSVLKGALLEHNMASVFMNQLEGRYIHSSISLGSRADSYYEYLLKQYIQTNKTEEVYARMYRAAMDSVQEFLIRQTTSGNLTYTSEMMPEMDANEQILMLGAVEAASFVNRPSIPPQEKELNDYGWKDWRTGKELIKTCLKTHDTATGLSPEIVYFRIASDGMDAYEWAPTDWYIRGAQPGVPPPYDARYMLRPETVESLFIAYRLTGDDIYREHGWRIFQAIEKHAKVPSGGYATVLNVDENPARLEDKMETFFLSETLKYLFLLFSDSDLLPLTNMSSTRKLTPSQYSRLASPLAAASNELSRTRRTLVNRTFAQ